MVTEGPTNAANAELPAPPPLPPLRLEGLELRRIRLPLRAPFVAAHGAEDVRDILLVRVLTADGAEGWGECAAPKEPRYTPEHVDGATEVIRRYLGPALLTGGPLAPHTIADRLAAIAGHDMAKAALEMAVLDAALRVADLPLATYLGATRTTVPAGVAVGLHERVGDLLHEVEHYVAAGYQRVKLKIEPGRDFEPVAAIRQAFPTLALQVDANQAYQHDQGASLAALDDLELLLVEQPLAADDLLGHATLARRLGTPVCLDESITSVAMAATALHLGSCRIITVKPGRLGGLLAARRLHDLCRAQGAPAWVGGMLETGLGRAANVALAALPGFTLPGDLSASDRYWAEDLTEPFVLDDGHLRVPTGPGLGVAPRPDVLAAATHWVEQLG